MIRTNKEVLIYINKLAASTAGAVIVQQVFTAPQQILEEGKNVYALYILKKGIAKCYFDTDTGGKFIQEFFGEGELFGEIELMDDIRSYCTVEAVETVTVYKILKKDFLQLIENDKKLNQLFIKALITKLKYKATRHSHNQLHTIEDNLTRLRLRVPDLENMIPKQDIADYLGITLRALNRTLKNMS
jgi:CRP-like cAMP-binding protein